MLSALLGTEKARPLSAEGDRGFWPFGFGATTSGQVVTAETAPRVAAVYACIRVLAETFASAPCITYKRKKTGGKTRAVDLPIYGVLHDAPNQWQTAFEFWEMAMFHLCLRGNFFAVIVPGVKGAVTELIPMHPDRVRIDRLTNGRLRYTFTDPGTGVADVYAQDEIFHIRGMSMDGLLGLSVIQYQKELIGGTMAADKYASAFFANDATPGVVLSTDQPLSKEARLETREQWERWHQGADKTRRTAVLAHGLKAMTMSVNNADSQFLETRGYNDVKIASIFRVPCHLIGILDRATFSNIEQQSLEFIMYSMLPWFRRVEATIARDLLIDPTLMVEFLVDGLLRGDIASRYTAYNTARNGGWLNGNEIRELENMNDMGPEGDVYLVQGAMVPIDVLLNPPEPSPAPVPPALPQDAPANSEIEKTADTQDISTVISTVKQLADEKVDFILATSSAEIARLNAERLAAEHKREQATEAATAIEIRAAGEVARAQEQVEHATAVANSVGDRAAGLEMELQSARDSFQQKVLACQELADNLTTTVNGIKKLAADELRGLIRVEINAMQRASHKHDFLSAIDKFYLDQKQRICESMKQPLALLEVACGTKHDPEAIAAEYCDTSLKALLEASGKATEKNLPEVISTLMADWEQRAAFLEN